MTIHQARNYSDRQQGSSSTEFTIIAILLLLLTLSIYEIARAHALRQLMQQALQESARAAAIHHLEPDIAVDRFNEAMLPWWATSGGTSAQAQQQSYQRFRAKYQLHPWQITILSPNEESFKRHADNRARQEAGTAFPTINNHYQYEHHIGLLRNNRGPLPGPLPGFQSHPSIFEANTITLQGIYLYEPRLLALRAIIAAASSLNSASSYGRQALAKGLIPLRVELSLGAQSHPVRWPISAHSAIQRASTRYAPPMPSTYERIR